jgi:hypothetical protein
MIYLSFLAHFLERQCPSGQAYAGGLDAKEVLGEILFAVGNLARLEVTPPLTLVFLAAHE